MKKILFLGIAFVGFTLAACNKDSVNPSATNGTTANASSGASASTDTSKNKLPRPPKLDSVAVSTLPSAITTYISTNYSGATIQKAGKDSTGNYVVLIMVSSQPKGLLFNASGVFQKELPAPPKGQGGTPPNGQAGPNGQQGPPPTLTSVTVSSLSSAITSYISTNYVNATISKAGTDSSGNFYILILQNNQPQGLLFDSSGKFQKKLPPPPPSKG